MKTVEKVQADVGFELEKIDISGDEELQRKYGQEIPVITINGRKAFKGRVTEQALRKKLKKAGAASGSKGAKSPKSSGLTIGALEELEPEPYVPPRAGVALALALMVAGVGFFVMRGVNDAQLGHGRLAETLLRSKKPNYSSPFDFNLPAFSGGQMGLGDFRGKVVFINFWATWCPPCVEEMPSMRRLQEKMSNDPNFVMLAISTDDDWKPVREFFAKKPPNFKVLLDKDGQLAKTYGTEKFPETYVVVDGKLVSHIVGPRDWDTWYAETYLRSLLQHGTKITNREAVALR